MIADYIALFPLTPLGGCFFIGIGLGLAAGAVLMRLRMWLVALGIALGLVVIFICAAPLSRGLPHPHPYAAISIIAAIVVEAIAFRVIMPKVRPLGDRQAGLATLAIVSTHFLIMIPAFGPAIALLTLLGLINVWRGWKRADLQLNRIWLIDGLLKIVFGIGMIATAPVIG